MDKFPARLHVLFARESCFALKEPETGIQLLFLKKPSIRIGNFKKWHMLPAILLLVKAVITMSINFLGSSTQVVIYSNSRLSKILFMMKYII